jgi:hypothetical protein
MEDIVDEKVKMKLQNSLVSYFLFLFWYLGKQL